MPTISSHDIASSSNTDLVLTIVNAEDSFPIKIRAIARLFDLKKGKQLSEFPVLHEGFGFGTRLAISNDGKIAFVGCYNTHAIAAYSLPNGKELWRRKDLNAVQTVIPIPDGNRVFCGREKGAAHILDGATGETVHKFTGVDYAFGSNQSNHILVAAKDLEVHQPLGKKIFSIKRQFKVLRHAIFSEFGILTNESGKSTSDSSNYGASVRCFDLKTGNFKWELPVPEQDNFTQLAFNSQQQCFVAFSRRKDASTFIYINPNSGTLTRGASIEKCGYGEFCEAGRSFLRGNLCLISTIDGKQKADLTTSDILNSDPKYKVELLRQLGKSANSLEELKTYMTKEGFSDSDIDRALRIKKHNA